MLIEKSKRYKNLGVKDDIASVKGNKKNGALAQLARAPALQAGCQGFESLMLHQIYRAYSSVG